MDDLVRVNERNTKRESKGFGVSKREQIIRTFTVELFAQYAIDV